jgi:hypothetical protein
MSEPRREPGRFAWLLPLAPPGPPVPGEPALVAALQRG